MKIQMSLIRTAFLVAFVFLPHEAYAAAAPFDVSNQTSRTVVIWIDNNVSDPASVGNHLEYAFNGVWTSDGTIGTITVNKDAVISAFATSGLPGTPANTSGWSDLVVTIILETGEISSMDQSGTLAIAGLGNQPFYYDLNTTHWDTTTGVIYSQTGFADVTFGPEVFTGWCTNSNAGQISGLACPPYAGPSPFGYSSETGRFNAIGATNLNGIIFAYSTFGDVRLFEAGALVPALRHKSAALLVVMALALGAAAIKRNAGAM